jgi:O-antigen ligase
MKTCLIYFLLFIYWAEKVMGLSLTNIVGLSFFNLIIYIFLFLWAFSVIKNRKIIEPHNVNKYLFLMVLVMLVAIPIKILGGKIPNISITNELIGVKSWANPILLFFVLFNIVDDEKTCKRALLGLIALLAITVLSQFLGAFGIIEYGTARFAIDGDSRVSGLGDVNDYASFLVLFIPLLLSSFLFKRGAAIKPAAAILLFLSFSGLIITGSRGGALSFLFSMLIYFLLLYREKMVSLSKIMLLCMMLTVVSGVVFLILPSKVTDAVTTRFDPAQSEDLRELTSGRTLIWSCGLRLFMESPIFGHGNRAFLPLAEKKFSIRAVAHNQYLEHLVNYGILGLTILLMMFLKLLQYVWNQLQVTRDIWNKQLYISYIAGFSGYLFSLLSINMSISKFPFWIYTALICTYVRLEMNEKQKKESRTFSGCKTVL